MVNTLLLLQPAYLIDLVDRAIHREYRLQRFAFDTRQHGGWHLTQWYLDGNSRNSLVDGSLLNEPGLRQKMTAAASSADQQSLRSPESPIILLYSSDQTNC